MGNTKSVSKWHTISLPLYSIRFEKSEYLGLKLNWLWDRLHEGSKHLVTKHQYSTDPAVKIWVNKLYAEKLAVAIRNTGESSYEVSNTINLDLDFFSDIVVASTWDNYVTILGTPGETCNEQIALRLFTERYENNTSTETLSN